MAAITYPLSATEALQEVRVILNEPTASFWTDEQINNWVILGANDVALKGLGVIKYDSITLATGTISYTALDVGSTGAVARILRVIAANYYDASTYKGLLRIVPTAIAHLPINTSGAPEYYFHFNDKFFVHPIPTSAENTKKVYIWYSETADDITDLPNHHQHFAIYYAASMAFAKMGRGPEAHYWMTLYTNGVMQARADLYLPNPDTRDMFQVPDRTVTL